MDTLPDRVSGRSTLIQALCSTVEQFLPGVSCSNVPLEPCTIPYGAHAMDSASVSQCRMALLVLAPDASQCHEGLPHFAVTTNGVVANDVWVCEMCQPRNRRVCTTRGGLRAHQHRSHGRHNDTRWHILDAHMPRVPQNWVPTDPLSVLQWFSVSLDSALENAMNWTGRHRCSGHVLLSFVTRVCCCGLRLGWCLRALRLLVLCLHELR